MSAFSSLHMRQIAGVLAIVLSTFSPVGMALAQASVFPDVPSTHVNVTAIGYMKTQGIMQGYPDGTFGPGRGITRAEFAKVIIGAIFPQSEIDACLANFEQLFSDTPSSEWYAPYLCVAQHHNIIGGYADGTFRPAQQINFVEANKILALSFSLEVNTDSSDPWYKPYIDATASVYAIPPSITSLDVFVTRAEIAEMVYRLKAGVENQESATYDRLLGIAQELMEQQTSSLYSSSAASSVVSYSHATEVFPVTYDAAHCAELTKQFYGDPPTSVYVTTIQQYMLSQQITRECIVPRDLLPVRPSFLQVIEANEIGDACQELRNLLQGPGIGNGDSVTYQTVDNMWFAYGCDEKYPPSDPYDPSWWDRKREDGVILRYFTRRDSEAFIHAYAKILERAEFQQ